MALRLDYNQKRVIDLLRSQGPQSRSQLVHSAQLTAPTLTRLTQNLIDHELIMESHRLHDGQRGKPAQLLALNPEGAYAAGIAVQTEYLSVCLIDLVGKVRGEAVKPLNSLQPAAVAKLSEQMLTRLIADAGVPRRRIVGAGISMPGTTFSETMQARRAGVPGYLPEEFADWRGVDFESLFTTALDLPTWFENSAKAATLADAYFGAGQALANFAAIHIAYGVGGGLILNRQLYRGVFGRAAEFGALFPYEDVRPSGRDLLIFLSGQMSKAPRQLRELNEVSLPPELLDAWAERVMPGLSTLCMHVIVTLDLPALVLNGLLPLNVQERLARGLRECLPRLTQTVPEILVSRLVHTGPVIGAASLPLYFVTAHEPD